MARAFCGRCFATGRVEGTGGPLGGGESNFKRFSAVNYQIDEVNQVLLVAIEFEDGDESRSGKAFSSAKRCSAQTTTSTKTAPLACTQQLCRMDALN